MTEINYYVLVLKGQRVLRQRTQAVQRATAHQHDPGQSAQISKRNRRMDHRAGDHRFQLSERRRHDFDGDMRIFILSILVELFTLDHFKRRHQPWQH